MLKRWLLCLVFTGSILSLHPIGVPATVNEVDPARNDYTANGTTTAFPYTFEAFVKTDLDVLVDGTTKTVDSDYTVSGLGVSGGGTVTFITAPASATHVTILRKQPASQVSNYVANEAFPAERIEKDLDKVVMQSQQTRETLKRTLRSQKEEALDMELPVVSARKSKVLGFDTNGLPTAVDLGATTGDISLSTITATGSTTARSLATRFAEVYNVKDYGATGNGIADDTAEIQATMTAAMATGGTVFLPAGTYLISSGITIDSTVQVVGAGWGTIIKVDSGATRFIPILVQGAAYAAVNGVVLRDFKVDGSGKGTLDTGLVQINDAVGFKVDHLWITNGGTPGESASQGVAGISVAAGALGEVGSEGTISNNLIEATTKAGINWSTESVEGLIIGNIVRNGTGNTQTPGIQVLGGYNAKVIGNSVHNNQGVGIFIGTSGGVGTYRHARYALVEGNHVYSNGQGSVIGSGIFIGNAGVASSTFGRIIVRSNVVYSNGVGVNADGIHVQNDDNVLIEDNYSYGNSLNGIKVEASTNVKVSHNTAESNNTANVANQSGIYVLTSASVATTSIDISNNKCFNGGSQHQKYPVYLDAAAGGTFTKVSIIDNDADGHETSDGLNLDYLPTRLFARHRRAGQTTANDTATNVFYAVLNDNSAARVTMKTTAMKSDGSDRAMYFKSALAYRDGAGATLQGAVQSTYEVESDNTWDHTIGVDTNSVRGRITGKAATTITWDSLIELEIE